MTEQQNSRVSPGDEQIAPRSNIERAFAKRFKGRTLSAATSIGRSDRNAVVSPRVGPADRQAQVQPVGRQRLKKSRRVEIAAGPVETENRIIL